MFLPLCHPDRQIQQFVNLDGDRAKEEVIAVDSHDCAHTAFTAYVQVRDRCRGVWRTYDFGSRFDVLQRFRIANADARTKRPELFFVTTAIAPVADGVAELIRFDDRRGGCARPRALFRYSPGAGVMNFDADLNDAAPQFRGLEIVLTEGREVAQRVTRYRYDRKLDRYVRYA
jgi:hypothetical protein